MAAAGKPDQRRVSTTVRSARAPGEHGRGLGFPDWVSGSRSPARVALMGWLRSVLKFNCRQFVNFAGIDELAEEGDQDEWETCGKGCSGYRSWTGYWTRHGNRIRRRGRLGLGYGYQRDVPRDSKQ